MNNQTFVSWRQVLELPKLLLLNPRCLFFYPGWSLMILGGTMMVFFMKDPILSHGGFDWVPLFFSGLLIMLGFQTISFASFAHFIKARFAGNQIESTNQDYFLEYGLLTSFSLLLVGLLGTAYAVLIWSHHGFGAIAPFEIMHIIIPSATFILLGIQCMLANFFLSLLEFYFSQATN